MTDMTAEQALIKALKDKLQSATAIPWCCGQGVDDGMSAPMCCGNPDFDWPDDVAELLSRADEALSQRVPEGWQFRKSEKYGNVIVVSNNGIDLDVCTQGFAGGIEETFYRLCSAMLTAAPAQSDDLPVAWMHDSPGRVDVIHASVKKLLVDFRDSAVHLHRPLDKSEHYTIPLYAHPTQSADDKDAEIARLRERVKELEGGEIKALEAAADDALALSQAAFGGSQESLRMQMAHQYLSGRAARLRGGSDE